MSNKKYEMVFCVVNSGFTESVMEAAKDAGARGGTVIHGRGTANKDAEEKFRITVQPDKEIIMIIVPEEIKDDVLTAIYNNAGLSTPSQGIAFSMTVDRAIGLSE